jgi:putative pyruvate formate lyase activating enzyme
MNNSPLEKIGLIRSRLKAAYDLLKSCRVCPRRCGVNRLRGETGFCEMGAHPVISSDNLHFGEEPPISGNRGSGTIFLTGCVLRCRFCQNYPISQLGNGNRVSIPDLADKMLGLQRAGAHNINFVTPTHFTPQIMAALLLAYRGGLTLPLVYNCGGYESVETLRLLDGIVDIYMPDMKYSRGEPADRYSSAPDYPRINRCALKEMHRQVGDLVLDRQGIAGKGLLIRHLVLPQDNSGTRDVMDFIAREISPKTYVSLMSQYFPAYEAFGLPPLHRRITGEEYRRAKNWLEDAGLSSGWIQDEPGF